MVSKYCLGKILDQTSKVKHFTECLELFLNYKKYMVANKIHIKAYIARSVLPVIRNNEHSEVNNVLILIIIQKAKTNLCIGKHGRPTNTKAVSEDADE
jgi:hypothetical protein